MSKLNFISLIIIVFCTKLTLAGNDLCSSGKVSASLSTGFLSGEAKERVYFSHEGGRKASQLDWKYSNVLIVKGNLDWDFTPRISLGASGWRTLTSKDGHMDDYDWLDANQTDWTHRSTHPDTRLNYANQFDLNVKSWILNEPEYRLGLMAGYQQSAFSWTSRGGSYNYDNGADIGEFEAGVKEVDYSQKFKLPYIGITGLYRYEKWEFNGAFKFSDWVRASTYDYHYWRDITYIGKASNQRYYGLIADVGYYLAENVKVFIEGTWDQILNKRANVLINAPSKGFKDYYFHDGGGIKHTNYMVTAGLKYTF